MAIPETADQIRTQEEAEQRLREDGQKKHEQLVTEVPDPNDGEGLRHRAEQQIETVVGQMPVWVQGAMDMPKGDSAEETAEDVGGDPERKPAEERRR